jgi:aldehyde dehydrogenase (NAD+)
MGIFDYAPAPESRAIVDINRGRATACSSTASSSRPPAAPSRPSTRPPRRCSPRSPRPRPRTSTAPWPPRAAPTTRSGRMPGASGPSTCSGSPGSSRSARASWPCWSPRQRQADQGVRDVDIPLVAAHFFYYAGWADKLDYAGSARTRAARRRRQVIPWNFPLLMLAWKIAPALACGNTVVLKPAETTPLTALLFAEICQQAELPARRGQHRHRRGRDRRGAGRAPGVDKVAFTGSTEVGGRSRARSPAPARS